MHAVHIESSFVYPSLGDCRVVGLKLARRPCHSCDSEIVRGFRVGFGDSVADGRLVLAALEEALWNGLVVGSVECAIDGMVVCAHDDGTVIFAFDDALFLSFFVLLEVDFVGMLGTVEVGAVAGDMM